jgi:predicted aspartyl protease
MIGKGALRAAARLAAIGVAMATALGADAARAACQVTILLELPVSLVAQKIVVPAKIGGTDTTLILDTGAFFNGLTPASAQRLGLQGKLVPPSLKIGGPKGTGWRVATVPELTLGGVSLRKIDFLIGGGIAEVGAAGRIGQNMFAGADMELDLAHGKVRILKAAGCQGRDLAYWAGAAAVSDVALDPFTPSWPQPRGMVMINGTPIHLMFDTGAQRSHLSRAAALKAGVDLSPDKVRPQGSLRRVVDGQLLPVVEASVGRVQLGEARATDVPMLVTDMATAGYEGLIGLDFFLAHRVVIDRAHARLYFTSEEGRLFADAATMAAADVRPSDATPAGQRLPKAAPATPPAP